MPSMAHISQLLADCLFPLFWDTVPSLLLHSEPSRACQGMCLQVYFYVKKLHVFIMLVQLAVN